jgi:hypothetical protein
LPASAAALSLLGGTSSDVEDALRAAAVVVEAASMQLLLLLPATAVPAAEAAATGVAAGPTPLALGLLRERHKLVNEVEREALPPALALVVLLLAPLAADPELGVAATTVATAA